MGRYCLEICDMTDQQKPVAYVPISQSPADTGQPIWRETRPHGSQNPWAGYECKNLYLSPPPSAGVIEALEIIAGERPPFDNLMGYADLARAALEALRHNAPPDTGAGKSGPSDTEVSALADLVEDAVASAGMKLVPDHGGADAGGGVPNFNQLAEAWNILAVLANTPPEEWLSKHEIHHEIAMFRGQPAISASDIALSHQPAPVESFQSRVQPWMMACFGAEISADRIERNHRFLEEALELVQSTGCTQSEAHQLVDYVYGRPQGEINQEVGGVMVTLAALCLANGIDMHEAAETELARIWTKVEKIRAKQAAKPKHSPLPGPSEPAPVAASASEFGTVRGSLDKLGRRVDPVVMPESLKDTIATCYGLLWHVETDSKYVHRARRGLLQWITKDEQGRGIENARAIALANHIPLPDGGGEQ
jgi:hypothetical protein